MPHDRSPGDAPGVARARTAARERVAPFLEPLGDTGAGEDISYSVEFDAVKFELDRANALLREGVGWRLIGERCVEMFERSRDLRVACYFAAARAHLDGLAGLLDGLVLLHGLQERLWEPIHPPLRRPRARANMLGWLDAAAAEAVSAVEPPGDADVVDAIDAIAGELERDLGEKLGDLFTGFAALRAAVLVQRRAREPRDLGLEAVIAARPDDPAAYLVYADWLTGQGSPRGELIAVQHALSRIPRGRRRSATAMALRARESVLLHGVEAIDTEIWRLEWRWGLLRGARVYAARRPRFEPKAAERLFASPVACALHKLDIGALSTQANGPLVEELVALAAASPIAPRLRVLLLDDRSADGYVRAGLGDVGAVGEVAFPRLARLVIDASAMTLRGLELPRGCELDLTAAAAQPLRALAAAELGIDRIQLTVHRFAPADALRALCALVAADPPPRLRALTLASGANDALCDAIAPGFLAQLEALEIRGALSPSALERLTARCAPYPALRLWATTAAQ